MLKVLIISRNNENKFWQETFSNVWEGPFEVVSQTNYEIQKGYDLIVLDFSSSTGNEIDILADISPNLVGKHFLIVSDKKDADLAIEGIKLGAIGFLVRPFKRFELISSLDKLHTSSGGHLPTKRKAKTVTITSYKGGTGVSTVVANLGYILSHTYQKKTLIIDAAGFSNHVNVLLNTIPKCSLADICKQGKNLDEEFLNNAASKINKNLGILGGLIKPSDFAEVNHGAIEHLLEIASDSFDFIVIDTPSHVLDELTMLLIQKSTDLLIVTTFDLLAIRDNRFYIQTLRELGISDHKIRPVINRQDWYIGSLEPELVQKQLNHSIYHSLPNDWNLCVEAANYGRPIIEVAPNSQLATSYKILGGKIAKADIPEETAQAETPQVKEKKKSILNWF